MALEDYIPDLSGIFGPGDAGSISDSLGPALSGGGGFASSDAGGGVDFGSLAGASDGLAGLGDTVSNADFLSGVASDFQASFAGLGSFFGPSTSGGGGNSIFGGESFSTFDPTTRSGPSIFGSAFPGISTFDSTTRSGPSIFGKGDAAVVSGSSWWRPLQSIPQAFLGSPATSSSPSSLNSGSLLILVGIAVLAVVLVAKKR